MRLRSSLILSALAMLAGGGALQAGPTPSAATPFTLLDQGGLVVDVHMNGAGPFAVLLDTGSSHSVLSEDVVRRLRLAPVATAQLTSSTGEGPRAVVRLDRLSLGPIAAVDVLPSVVPAASFHSAGEVQGLVGQDVLAARRYTIDYRQRRLVWHDAAPPLEIDGSTLALDVAHGRYLVRLPQRGELLRLVPDSGAGGLVLFDGPGLALLAVTDEAGAWFVDGLMGRREARQVSVRTLRVGDLPLRDVPAAVIASPGQARIFGDGLLPLHFFDRVTFDGPARRLRLERRVPSTR